jgi:ATP synthase F0 subunit b
MGVLLIASEHEATRVVLPKLDELIWGAVAFVIFFIILSKFAFPALQKALREREDGIRGELERAEQVRLDAEEQREEYRQRLAEARAESDRIIREANETAEQVRRERTERAEEEARQIVERARQEAVQNTTALAWKYWLRLAQKGRAEEPYMKYPGHSVGTRRCWNRPPPRLEERADALHLDLLGSAYGPVLGLVLPVLP